MSTIEPLPKNRSQAEINAANAGLPRPTTKTPRKPRAPRRNFATERTAVVRYCKVSIQVLRALVHDPATARTEGKIVAYLEILKEMGEVAE